MPIDNSDILLALRDVLRMLSSLPLIKEFYYEKNFSSINVVISLIHSGNARIKQLKKLFSLNTNNTGDIIAYLKLMTGNACE